MLSRSKEDGERGLRQEVVLDADDRFLEDESRLSASEVHYWSPNRSGSRASVFPSRSRMGPKMIRQSLNR